MLASTLTLAKEPANLAAAKQKLKKYHDSGAYIDDIADTIQQAMRYLELRVARGDFKGKKPAIVLDIDETSLSNYSDMVKLDFGGPINEIRQNQGAAIPPTLKLYRYAKAHHIAVFFISSRLEQDRQTTEENLKQAGFTDYDGLILRAEGQRKSPVAAYKTAVRKRLTNEGYDILVNIGDQKSDLRGGYADETFKLPNPYYLTP